MMSKALKLYRLYLKRDSNLIFMVTLINFIMMVCICGIMEIMLRRAKNSGSINDTIMQIYSCISIDLFIVLTICTIFFIVSTYRRFSSEDSVIYNYMQLPISKVWIAMYGYIEVLIFMILQIVIYFAVFELMNMHLISVFQNMSLDGSTFESLRKVMEHPFIYVFMQQKFSSTVVINILIAMGMIFSTIIFIMMLIKKLRLNIAASATILISIFVMNMIIVLFTGFGGIFALVPERMTTFLSKTSGQLTYIIVLNAVSYTVFRYKMDF